MRGESKNPTKGLRTDSKDSTAIGVSLAGTSMMSTQSESEDGKAQPAGDNVDSGKLPLRVKLLLGMGEAVQGMYITIGGYYLNSFLLETACIDPVYVGAMQAIQGVFDAMNDPFIGSLSDRTRTRFGRRRPWLLFGGPWLAAFYFGLWFSLPKEVPQFGRFLFALTMYCGVSIGITSIQVQVGALVPELTDNYDERTQVSGWRILLMAIMGLITALGHGKILKFFPDDPAMGYKISAVVIAFLMWLFAWTVFAGIKEKFQARQESTRKMPVLTQVCSIWRNKSFLCVTGVYLCGPSAVVTIQSNFYMFSKYILRDPDVLPILMLCAQGIGMVCLPLWVLLSMRFDKRFVYMVGGTGFMVAMCAIFFVQTREQAIGAACLCGLNIGVVYLIPYSMLPDVVDEDELRTGKRREGIYAGFFTTALKFSATLALTFTNLMLKGFGYSPPQTTCGADLVEDTGDDGMGEAQSGAVLLCIRMLCSFVPGAYMFFAVLCAYLFPITRQKQAAIAKLVAKKRLERAWQVSDGLPSEGYAQELDQEVLKLAAQIHPSDAQVSAEASNNEVLKAVAEVHPNDAQVAQVSSAPGVLGGQLVDGRYGHDLETPGPEEPSCLRSTAKDALDEAADSPSCLRSTGEEQDTLDVLT